ncbi:trehalose-phosphatase [Stutzerimonas azotifigens]|uniref:Trehalose 6-phosphate phosphatase n=1 Tax=Stutzerimonas azotifigens TaxID=291995 RepID=A0ABR5Z735_9GAMM|nr:trehalose-phosphatase [Stutzerimonas azotifigens]MBA1275995.1 trehalose-phosphatase [Stutzerimonas azotifigens]
MTTQQDSSPLDLRHCAFFFDVDGTLAEIQPRPEQVFIPPVTLRSIEQLQTLGVPVAVVSGRRIEELDRLLSPLRLPAAGVHGAERRGIDGTLHHLALDAQALQRIEQELTTACDRYPGLRLENKGVAFALHYRQAPELEPQVRELAEDFAQRYADVLSLQPGKCVFELKPKGASKGEVIRDMMREAPFNGRVPVFVGDDLTDEAGFAVVDELGGYTYKVGTGETLARQRFDSVAAVSLWLNELLSAAEAPGAVSTKNKSEGQS